MNASEAASLVKVWAAENGFVNKERFRRPFEEELESIDLNVVPLGAAATPIFHNRGIAFIGFSEAERQVLVFTHKRITKRDRQSLPKEIGDGISILYRQGNTGTAGGPPSGAFGQGPYSLHNGRYTCGSSVTPASVWGAGSLGCLVRDTNGELYGLSCNHVVGLCNFAEPGIPILAPAGLDVHVGGCDPFTIGYHSSLLPQLDGIPQNVPIVDNTDAAIFRVRDPNLVSSMQREYYDSPSAIAQIAPSMLVEKVGRTSGRTSGIVRAQTAGPEPITYNLQVIPGSRKVVFYDPLYVVESPGNIFAEEGDSGSLVTAVINGARCAVGIVTGINSQSKLCYVLPIGPILARFNVTLVSGHNV